MKRTWAGRNFGRGLIDNALASDGTEPTAGGSSFESVFR